MCSVFTIHCVDALDRQSIRQHFASICVPSDPLKCSQRGENIFVYLCLEAF